MDGGREGGKGARTFQERRRVLDARKQAVRLERWLGAAGHKVCGRRCPAGAVPSTTAPR